jgi:hypothetical protein
MAATFSHAIAGTGRWLRKEMIALWPVFLFFLVGFILLILLIKLTLAQFSVEVTLFSNAIIGALLAAKAALILDETPLARELERYRRIVAIAVKMIFYGITSLLLLFAERILEGLHKYHNWGQAYRYVFRNGDRWLLVWGLGISIVFALYFTFGEISERLGEGELWRLLFEPHKTLDDPRRASNVAVGGRS